MCYTVDVEGGIFVEPMKQYAFSDIAREGEWICMNESMFNHGLDIHTHDFFEITLITKGNGLYTQNRRVSGVAHGDLVMVSPEDVHRFEPLTHDFRWVNCIFLPQALCIESQELPLTLSSLFEAVEQESGTRFASQKDMVLRREPSVFSHIFSDMLNEYTYRHTGYRKIMELQLRLLLKKIHYSFDADEDAIRKRGFLEEDLRLLVQSFFHQSSSYAKVDLEMVARKAHVSPKYFSELFKRRTGRRFSDYVTELRMERAAEMLRTTGANVQEIMQYVGYRDSKFFYSAFKAHFGMTPAEYRRKSGNTL